MSHAIVQVTYRILFDAIGFHVLRERSLFMTAVGPENKMVG